MWIGGEHFETWTKEAQAAWTRIYRDKTGDLEGAVPDAGTVPEDLIGNVLPFEFAEHKEALDIVPSAFGTIVQPKDVVEYRKSYLQRLSSVRSSAKIDASDQDPKQMQIDSSS